MRASPSQRAKPTAVIGGASERPRWTVVTERADGWRVPDGGATLESASECVGGKGAPGIWATGRKEESTERKTIMCRFLATGNECKPVSMRWVGVLVTRKPCD